jgi:hypothetical protein
MVFSFFWVSIFLIVLGIYFLFVVVTTCFFLVILDIHLFHAPLVARLLLATFMAHFLFNVMAACLFLVLFTCFLFVVVAIHFLLATFTILAIHFLLATLKGPLFLSIGSMENLKDVGRKVMYPTKGPLEMDSCGFTTVYGATISTTLMDNNLSAYVMVQWDLLAKQRGFWKNKQCITTTWAFYAPLNSFLTLVKVNLNSNSNSNQLEQLKCVVYYLNDLVAELKKCDKLQILQMVFLHFISTWNPTISNFGVNGVNKKRMG